MILARGEWDNEPNWKSWTDEDSGYSCLILRNIAFGTLCGYVGVPEIHPYFNKDMFDLWDLNVHGGITFTGVPGMAAVYESADDTLWWFGFDCAHAGDLVPMLGRMSPNGETYKNMDYVEAECTKLAKELKELANG